MVLIQIELTEEQNRKVGIIKAGRGFVSKKVAIACLVDDAKLEDYV